MSDSIRCPDCGRENPAGSVACSNCNFPLDREHESGRAETNPPAEEALAWSPPPRRVRPRPPRPQPQSLSIWLMAAAVVAIAVVIAGIRGFHQSNFPAVEGAKEGQQQAADRFRAELSKDSTS